MSLFSIEIWDHSRYCKLDKAKIKEEVKQR